MYDAYIRLRYCSLISSTLVSRGGAGAAGFPRPLLTFKDNNYANRLFNVAMTRTKGKFIAAANAHFMERKLPKRSLMFSDTQAFAKVLSAVSKMNQVIDYGVAEEGSSDRKTFAGYIRATKVCPECGKPLQLKKSQKKKGHYEYYYIYFWIDELNLFAYVANVIHAGRNQPSCLVDMSLDA